VASPYDTVFTGGDFMIDLTWNQPEVEGIAESLWERSRIFLQKMADLLRSQLDLVRVRSPGEQHLLQLLRRSGVC
jgi:hypothetical protein